MPLPGETGIGGIADMKRRKEQEQQQEQQQGATLRQSEGMGQDGSNASRKNRLPGIVTITKSACDYLQIDYNIVFNPCCKAAGSSIEAIVLLMRNMRPEDASNNMVEMPPDEVDAIHDRLSKSKNKDDKNNIIRHVWSNMPSSQMRVFLQSMNQSRINSADEKSGSNANDLVTELQTQWFSIIHATRIGGSKLARFSDYVLGIRIDEDGHAEPRWVPIGKIAGRAEHSLASQIDALLANAVVERFGPTVSIHPEAVIVEVRHRGLRENPRTKAGRVLVEPEITRLLG
jgi:hypothetical protein